MQALLKIDTRLIYLLTFVVVAVAVLATLGLPVRVTPPTKALYDFVEKLPAGTLVWVGMDYGPGSKSELDPQVVAFFHHVFKKDLKVVIHSMWTMGGKIGQELVEPIAAQYGKEYGRDWVNLGYKPGNETNLRLCTSSIKECAANVDHLGSSLDHLPLMQQARALDKNTFGLAITFNTGTPGIREYLAIVQAEKQLALADGTLQMSVPEDIPFFQSGQLVGMFPGVRGAAEYEVLVGVKGAAVKAADGQSLAALYVAILVILGNIGYLTARRAATAQ